MGMATQSAKVTIALVMTLVGSRVSAQSASSDAEIAALKKQLRLMEEKLDRLQKQTTAKTVAAVKANAKTEPNANVTADGTNGVVPVKAPPPPPDAIVKMPNNRPMICTAGGTGAHLPTGIATTGSPVRLRELT